MKPLPLVIALALCVPSTPALAQPVSAATSHDLQCFIVSLKLMDSKTEQMKNIGLMSAMYYAGKIFGGAPDIDLAAALKAEMKQMTPDSMNRLPGECGKELGARGSQISAAGAAISADPAASATP